jgi:hypothetical protein
MNDDRLARLLGAERARLEGAAPAPDFAALERRVASLRRARLEAISRVAVAGAAALLALGLAASLLLGAAGHAAVVIAAALLWILSDAGLFARRAVPQ